MSKRKLGKIEKISITEVFNTERDFSQYLNEHLDLLSDVLGIDLSEVGARQKFPSVCTDAI